MSLGDIATYREDDVWHNLVQGGERLGAFGSQELAVLEGRNEARRRGVAHLVLDSPPTGGGVRG